MAKKSSGKPPEEVRVILDRKLPRQNRRRTTVRKHRKGAVILHLANQRVGEERLDDDEVKKLGGKKKVKRAAKLKRRLKHAPVAGK